jgi:hypothetical protein
MRYVDEHVRKSAPSLFPSSNQEIQTEKNKRNEAVEKKKKS